MTSGLPPEDRAILDLLHAKNFSPAAKDERSHHDLAMGVWMPCCRGDDEDVPDEYFTLAFEDAFPSERKRLAVDGKTPK